MNIYKKYAPIYRDATVLLRPRTPLKDMYLALDPGTRSAGAIPAGGDAVGAPTPTPTSTSRRSSPRWTPTRATTWCCCCPAAPGVPRPGRQRRGAERAGGRAPARHAQALRAAEPRHADASPRCWPQRQRNLRRSIHNLNLVAGALGGVDGQLASLIRSSDTNFPAISANDAQLEQTLSLFPGTLQPDPADARQGPGVLQRQRDHAAPRCSRSRATSGRRWRPRGRCSATRRR